MGNKQPTFFLIPTQNQVIYQLRCTNRYTRYVRIEQRKITESDDVSTVMNSPLSYKKLNNTLSNIKLNKSPGPDVTTNEMIVNLGQPALHKLQYMFNKTLQE